MHGPKKKKKSVEPKNNYKQNIIFYKLWNLLFKEQSMREQKWPVVEGLMGIGQSYLVMVLSEGQPTDTAAVDSTTPIQG